MVFLTRWCIRSLGALFFLFCGESCRDPWTQKSPLIILRDVLPMISYSGAGTLVYRVIFSSQQKRDINARGLVERGDLLTNPLLFQKNLV